MPTSEITFAFMESPEGGYEARAVGHSIFTEANSLKELKSMIREAAECHFTNQLRPRVIHLRRRKKSV